MNIRFRASFSTWADTLVIVRTGACAVTLMCLGASSVVAAGGKTADGPGTAVVAPGARSARFELDSIPAGTYEIVSKETLVRYGIDHMGFSMRRTTPG